jgi:ATP-dependent RNA helicase DeaD
LFFRRKRSETAGPVAGATTSHPVALAPAPSAEHHARHDQSHHHPPAPHDAVAAPPARRRPRRRGRNRSSADQASPAAHATPPTPPPLAPVSGAFRALGLDDTALQAIAALGFETPTPIQAEALPLMLAGEDVVGQAQTGTGKTLAFGLPLARAVDPSQRRVQALVLVPTRELAHQVRDVLLHLARFYGFTTISLVGGRPLRSDFAALEKGAHVVVGTPGRVIDHLQRGTLSLAAVRFAVLDEADEMLDIGFARDIDRILRTVPRDRQTGLFSATIPESIRRLVYRYMRKAVNVSVAPEQKTADGVAQFYCEVAEREKILALRHLYENMDLGRSLVFRRTKIGVDRLTRALQDVGVPARAIHGDLRQGERDRVMADFKGGRLEFLVATNVAARGLDIPDVEHVINYDVPQNPEEYIHRIGRTARAGKKGSAITFVGEWDLKEWDAITEALGAGELHAIQLPARWE